MKTVILLAGLLALASAAEKYNSKYDNFDVEPIISNDRLLKAYLNCFLDKGRCTSEGADFKKALPEAISEICGKCTEKQKQNLKKVARTTKKRYPEMWTAILSKHDPSGKHKDAFEKFIES